MFSFLKQEEQGVVVGGGGPGIVPGVAFPVDDVVIQQLKQLKAGSVTYVQLAIDIEKERIVSGGAANITIDQLPEKFPNDQPRFHFFDFVHQHEGSTLHSIGTLPHYYWYASSKFNLLVM